MSHIDEEEPHWYEAEEVNGQGLIDEAESPWHEAEEVDDEGSIVVQADSREITPREYQIEMANASMASNCIVWISTGGGKTLIAALVMRRLRQIERTDKKFVFLAPNVALTEQQGVVLREYLKCSVSVYNSNRGVDAWDRDQWLGDFDRNDLFVMTPQVLLDNLMRAYISMNQLALIVFDECHHARKKHPFNCILQEFYHTAPVEQRPKILGLTACPAIGGVRNLETQTKQDLQMLELERNLDAKIIKPTFVDEDLFCAHPDETIVFFKPCPEEVHIFYLHRSLHCSHR